MTVGSLFSGIGGFDLGLERAGFEIRWQVEIDPYCNRVLAKHWPNIPKYGDIRAIDWRTVEPVDVLCGGFPCQDLSFAGKRAGIDGERSGLWSEYVRAIRSLRPRYIIVENVPGLLTHAYMGRVLGDLAESGYDAEWDCIPAAAVGAPHRRDRVWIVAYPEIVLWEASGHEGHATPNGCGPDVADSTKARNHQRVISFSGALKTFWTNQYGESGRRFAITNHWATEPELGRVAHGIPDRVHRLSGLGNAVVPQIVEWIGRQILATGHL